MTIGYYNMEGQPISEQEASKLLASFDDTRAIAHSLYNHVEISTVLLVFDMNFGTPPPLIFETMISGGVYDDHIERYSTKEEAVKGHVRLLKMVKASFEEE